MDASRSSVPAAVPVTPASAAARRAWRDRLWNAAAGLVAVVAVAVLFLAGGDGAIPRPVPPPGSRPPVAVAPTASPDRPAPAADDVVATLTAAGYDAASAAAVAAYHAEFLAALAADSPPARDRVLDRLGVLAKYPDALAYVRTHPEYAGLLAAVTDARAAANALRAAGDDAVALVNCLLLAADRSERDAAVAVFARHGTRIAKLQRAGLLGVETLFPADPTTDGERTYDRCLADALDAAGRDDDRLAAVILFARDRGPDLRRRLAADPAFRGRFAGDLWPALRRACERPGRPLELYLDEPRVWDLLLRPDGEALLAAGGPLAVELLFGPTAYPPALHDRIAHLLLAGYQDVLAGLVAGPFRQDPQFRDLLAEPIPDDLFAGAVARLLAAGANFRDPLAKLWAIRTDPAALKAAVVGQQPSALDWIPLYAAGVAVRKLAAGERVSDDEWLGAGLDVVGSVAPVAKIVRAVARTAVTQTLLKSATGRAARRLGQGGGAEAIERAVADSPREVRRWTQSALLAKSREEATTAGRLAVDVTAVVRLMYRRTGVGREGFRRATGLDARVFLRADARVFLHVDRLLIDKALTKTSAYLDDLVRRAVEDDLADAAANRTTAARSAAVLFLLDALPPAPGQE